MIFLPFGSVTYDHLKDNLFLLVVHCQYILNISNPDFETPGLKLIHLNCRSLFCKLDEIIDNFKTCDVITCSETWLSKELSDSLVFFPDKKIYRLDRSFSNRKMRGGGVCII